MKNKFRLKIVISVIVMSLTFVFVTPRRVFADGGEGFGQVFNFFFGDEKAREKMDSCEDGDSSDQSNRGILGMVNSFFCHMEKDMGITGTGSATKTFEGMSVHAEVTGSAGSAGVSANGGSYDYQAKVWVCVTGCTSAGNFSRAFYIAWSYKADKTVNKGYLVTDPSAFQGGTGSGMEMSFDIGSDTTTKTISAKMVHSKDGTTFKMRADATKVGDELAITMLMVPGSTTYAMRFSAKLNKSTGSGVAYFEGTGQSGAGTNSVSLTAASDTPNGMVFTSTKSTRDRTFTGAGTTAAAKTFPNESINDVNAYTANGLKGGYTTVGMDASPSSI